MNLKIQLCSKTFNMQNGMNIFRCLLLVFLIFLFGCKSATHRKASSPKGASRQLATASTEKLYLLLISLDGYRYDYTERFHPPNLSRFISEGVQSKSLIPCFPSKTFPNHYSIATGMRPENHLLVDNTFYDRKKEKMYRISDRSVVEDGSWYGGSPIWVQASKAGIVTASYFFVGSEADIQGIRPDYYYPYDGSVPNEERVRQVLEWLELPEDRRPRMITMYFSDMDDVGHRFGPNNDEKLKGRLFELDKVLGKLFAGVESSGLPVNIIIVSDHGMTEVRAKHLLNIDLVRDGQRYITANNGALVHLYLKRGVDPSVVYDELSAKKKHFEVYLTKDSPFYATNRNNPRLGELLVVPEFGYYFSSAKSIEKRKAAGQKVLGEHGFSPEHKDLHGIFYARGPALKKGLTIESFENIHIYPLLCEILGLSIPEEVDGDAKVLESILLKKQKKRVRK